MRSAAGGQGGSDNPHEGRFTGEEGSRVGSKLISGPGSYHGGVAKVVLESVAILSLELFSWQYRRNCKKNLPNYLL